MVTEKRKVASELLNNTTNEFMRSLIGRYLTNIDIIGYGIYNDIDSIRLIRLDNCISYLVNVAFDITGWMLFDVPISYSYCFWNGNTKKAFDLAVWDIGEVIPRYLDSPANENDANSIDEAMKLYDISDYINAAR
jgi:hypothetical protein